MGEEKTTKKKPSIPFRLYSWGTFLAVCFGFGYVIASELSNGNFHKLLPNKEQNLTGSQGDDTRIPFLSSLLAYFGLDFLHNDIVAWLVNGAIGTGVALTLYRYSPAAALLAYCFVIGNFPIAVSPVVDFGFGIVRLDGFVIVMYAVAASFASSQVLRLNIAVALFTLAVFIVSSVHEGDTDGDVDGYITEEWGGRVASFASQLKTGNRVLKDTCIEELDSLLVFYIRLSLLVGYLSMIVHDFFIRLLLPVCVEIVHMSWIILTAMVIVETLFEHLFLNSLTVVTTASNSQSVEKTSTPIFSTNEWLEYTVRVCIPVFSIVFGMCAVLLRIIMPSLSAKKKGDVLKRTLGSGFGVLIGLLLLTQYNKSESDSSGFSFSDLHPSLFVFVVAAMYVQSSFLTGSTKASYFKGKLLNVQPHLCMVYVSHPKDTKVHRRFQSEHNERTEADVSIRNGNGKRSANTSKQQVQKGSAEGINGSVAKNVKVEAPKRAFKYNDIRVKECEEDLMILNKRYLAVCYKFESRFLRTSSNEGAVTGSVTKSQLNECRGKCEMLMLAANVAKSSEALAKLIREIATEVEVERDCLKQVKRDLNVMIARRNSKKQSVDPENILRVKNAITSAMDSYADIRHDRALAEENVEKAMHTFKFRSNDCAKTIRELKAVARGGSDQLAMKELKQLENEMEKQISDVSMFGVSAALDKQDSIISIDVGVDSDQQNQNSLNGSSGAQMLNGVNSPANSIYSNMETRSTTSTKRSKWFWSRHKRSKLKRSGSFDSDTSATKSVKSVRSTSSRASRRMRYFSFKRKSTIDS